MTKKQKPRPAASLAAATAAIAGFILPTSIYASCPTGKVPVNYANSVTYFYKGMGDTQAQAISDCQSKPTAIIDAILTACRALVPSATLTTSLVNSCNDFIFYDYYSAQWYTSGAGSYDCCVPDTTSPLPTLAGVSYPPPDLPTGTPATPPVPTCAENETQLFTPYTEYYEGRDYEDADAIAACNTNRTNGIATIQSSLDANYSNYTDKRLVINTSDCYLTTIRNDAYSPNWKSASKIHVVGCGVPTSSPSPSPTDTPTPSPSPSDSPSPSPSDSPSPSPSDSPSPSP